MIDLREKRIEKGIQQKELALRVGTSKALICAYEKGYRTPKPKTAKKIAAELDFDWTKFYEDQEETPGIA